MNFRTNDLSSEAIINAEVAENAELAELNNKLSLAFCYILIVLEITINNMFSALSAFLNIAPDKSFARKFTLV